MLYSVQTLYGKTRQYIELSTFNEINAPPLTGNSVYFKYMTDCEPVTAIYTVHRNKEKRDSTREIFVPPTLLTPVHFMNRVDL